MDPYYSRTSDQGGMIPRQDPTLWGDGDGPLSESQLADFRRDGFLFFSRLFSETEVDELKAEAVSLTKEWPTDRPGLIREPDSESVRSVFRLHAINARYERLFADERLRGKARQLLGSDVYVHQSRINYKPALVGKEFFWHSDFETWHVEDGMPRMRAVSMSLFLTESHEFNGPLMVVPGSHETYVRCAGQTPEKNYEKSLRRQEIGIPSREALEQLVRDSPGIAAPKGPAGSVVFFDCNLMHASCGNLSPTPRINLFAVYNSVENRLRDPYCARQPRPNYLAEREIQAVG